MAAVPTLIQRDSGGGERSNVGKAYKLGNIVTVSDVRREMVKVMRLGVEGKLELEGALRLTRILRDILHCIHTDRKHELENRRLDLLGAAAETGIAFFQGIAIIAPAGAKTPQPKQIEAIEVIPEKVTVSKRKPIGAKPKPKPKRKASAKKRIVSGSKPRKPKARTKTTLAIKAPKR